MKAVRIHETGGPDVLRFEDAEAPTAGSGQLLIEVEAIGLNFIEVYHRAGQYPMTLPLTLGTEAAGSVRGIGAGVTGFKTGDRVVSQSVRGAYAECAVVPADKAVVVPEGISSKVAAAIWLQGLTAHYLTTSVFRLAKGQSALVHAAAGGVGLMLCQMARRAGAFVIGTASTEAKRAMAHDAGAEQVIDYTTQDFAAETKRITGGAGVNVVYDSVGKTTFDKSLDCLAPRGMMALFGQSSGPVPPFDPQILNRKGSLFLTRPKLDNYLATRDELESRAKELFDWVGRGVVHAHIGAEFPLSRVADAHRALEARQTTGKVILIPD